MSDILVAKLLAAVEALWDAHSALGYSGKTANATEAELLRDDIYDALTAPISAVDIATHLLTTNLCWQPMETAPTDGTLILAWCGEPHSDPAVVRADWSRFRNEPYVQWVRPEAYEDPPLWFTHWMPIPGAPR